MADSNIMDCSVAPLLMSFFNDTATTEIYTLSLHDALPISRYRRRNWRTTALPSRSVGATPAKASADEASADKLDRKSTRLNSSHSQISYAVFCLKKKKHHIVDTNPGILSLAVTPLLRAVTT